MKVVIHEEEGPYMQGQKLYFSVEGRSMQLKALHFLEAVPGKQFQVLNSVSLTLHGWAVSGTQVYVLRGPCPHEAVAVCRNITHCLLIGLSCNIISTPSMSCMQHRPEQCCHLGYLSGRHGSCREVTQAGQHAICLIQTRGPVLHMQYLHHACCCVYTAACSQTS